MTKLVILLPTGGTVHTKFMTCLIGLTQALPKRGVSFAIKTYAFSDLVMSRNYLASYFLSQKEFTHALLLDSDLEFNSAQFFKLLDFDADFTAAPYPDRRVTASVLKRALSAATPEDLADGTSVQLLLANHMRYIATKNAGSEFDFQSKTDGDFATYATVGTGFMLIKRNVVERIYNEGHAQHLDRTGKLLIYADAPQFGDFFSHHLTAEKDAFYGEDQSFCRRWVLGCGGDIWVDRRAKVTHIGEFSYYGDFTHQSGVDQAE